MAENKHSELRYEVKSESNSAVRPSLSCQKCILVVLGCKLLIPMNFKPPVIIVFGLPALPFSVQEGHDETLQCPLVPRK